MKVFWAWQADLPGKISRHLIREALEVAIDKLKQPRDIEEPFAESRRDDLHLDHDTKGLRGSPEIAHEIFKKIDAASVVVADVTPIGRGPDRPNRDGKPQPPKLLINPNVAIELGYAYGKHGTDCFLAVLNRAYGDEDDLPFDIVHRRHPISYTLKEGASNDEIEREKKTLIEQLVVALDPYLTSGGPTSPETSTFNEAQPKFSRAKFFTPEEVLAHLDRPPTDFVMPFHDLLYLRVVPRIPLDGHLDLHMLRQNVGKYGTFGLPSGMIVSDNRYGVIVASPAGNTSRLDDLIQYFRTGEIWCVNADILRQGEQGNKKYLFTHPIEETCVKGLISAMRFHREVTGIAPPFRVEVGLTGVGGRIIAHAGYTIGGASPVLASDLIVHEAVLNRIDPQTLSTFLMDFFEKFNKDSGVPRLQGLYGRQTNSQF